MKELLTFCQPAFDWTWKTSAQSALLVVLVLLLHKLLGRWLTPRLRYALSCLIFCRLLLPFAPSSSLSLNNLLPQINRPPKPELIATPSGGSAMASASQTQTLASNQRPLLSVGEAACLAWFGGVGLLAGVAGWRCKRWQRIIRKGKPVTDPRLLELLRTAAEAMGVRRPVTLVTVPEISSPAVFGIRRVRVLLPEAPTLCLTDQEWRLIFLHEMAHVRNCDAPLNLLLMGLQFLHWFNPIVWLGLHHVRADRELVCDAMVLKRVAPSERLNYARLMVKLVESLLPESRPLSSAIAEVSSKSEVRRRIIMIKHHRKPSWVARVGTLILIVALGCLTFTRAMETPEDPGGSAPGSNPLLVNIDAQGSLRLGQSERPLSAQQLKMELLSATEKNPNLALGLRVDQNAPYTAVIRVLDVAKDCKISQVSLEPQQAPADDAASSSAARSTTEPGKPRVANVVSSTNGVILTYGQFVLTAKQLSVDLDARQVRAQGQVRIQQPGLVRSREELTGDRSTNQTAPQPKVVELKIRVVGPQLVKEDDIRTNIHVQIGVLFDRAAVDQDVRNLYATGLFYNARVVDEMTAAGVNLVYVVQCNPRLAALKFVGNTKFSDADLQKIITSRVGGSVNERRLFLDSQQLQESYQKAGYQGASVRYVIERDEARGEAIAVFHITEPH